MRGFAKLYFHVPDTRCAESGYLAQSARSETRVPGGSPNSISILNIHENVIGILRSGHIPKWSRIPHWHHRYWSWNVSYTLNVTYQVRWGIYLTELLSKASIAAVTLTWIRAGTHANIHVIRVVTFIHLDAHPEPLFSSSQTWSRVDCPWCKTSYVIYCHDGLDFQST